MNKEYAGICKKLYYFDKNLKISRTETILGNNADKITIVLLSLNRSEYTLLLLESLYEHCPDFAGKVMIADNGSESCEIEKIKRKIDRYPFEIKLYEFGENLGVAKGRNRAFELAETEWIFSLDNDIFFVENPFPKVEETLSETGARFCNLPLLNETGGDYINNGGHLWINIREEEKHFISCGPIFTLERDQGNTEDKSVLSTFLFGGCAFYHKETFLVTGGFDEKYFVGFEDIDYSLLLFQCGYKIANCCYACLVHNHPHDESFSSYDKERYKYEIIKSSAAYFKEKNGYEVWDDVTEQFFIEQSLKRTSDDRGKRAINEIYQNAKENYRKTCLKSINKENEETNQKSQAYTLALEQTIREYKIMDEDLRTHNTNQEKAINELKAMNDELKHYSQNQEKTINELKAMNDELRHYNQNQEKANTELNAQATELKTMNEDLKRYSLGQERVNTKLNAQIVELKTMNGELRQYSLDQGHANTELNAQANELKTMNEELRQYSLEQERVNTALNAQAAELKTMNEELRQYSLEQERVNTTLNAQAAELTTMNKELRQYSLEQEHANAELNAQVVELKRQLDDLSNLSQKEKELIQFLRKRKK